jgi:hypothetical protein
MLLISSIEEAGALQLEGLKMILHRPVASPRTRHRLAPNACLAFAAVALSGCTGWTYQVDKWWADRSGDWKSNDWTTKTRDTQMLRFKTCRITNHQHPYSDRVTIELIEVKRWLPDVRVASWRYDCNDSRQEFISPRTSSTDFHFDYESAADWPETAGSMTVFHS